MVNLLNFTPQTIVKLVFLFLSFQALSSCESEEERYFWSACMVIGKGDGAVTLNIMDPRASTLYVSPGPVNPDYFDIMIAEDPKVFSVFKRVDITTSTVKVDNLVNGKPYYFVLVSNKKGFAPVYSDTLMTIPSPARTTELYLPDLNFSVKNVATSYDGNYLSFIGSGDILYCTEIGMGTIGNLGSKVHSARWSPAMNHLAYLNTNQLNLFEPGTQETTTFELPFIRIPSFTPDGTRIAFFSSENNEDKHMYDLWTMDIETNEKVRVTHFEEKGFYFGNNYDWSRSGEEIYLDGFYSLTDHNTQGIYRYSLLTKKLDPVIVTGWGERAPSLSPDENKIAFVSNRTGIDEIWIYDNVELTFSQVTGDLPYRFDSHYSNLQWLDTSRLLATLSNCHSSTAIAINLKNTDVIPVRTNCQ